MKVTSRASNAVEEFSADDEQEESGEECVASSAWSSLSLILETRDQSRTMTQETKNKKSTSALNVGYEKFSEQPRWKLRKRKVVLYDQEMIDGDTSMEGLVDEDLWLSRKRKGSKLMKKLRPRCKSASSGTLTAVVDAPDPEYMPAGRKDDGKKIVEINEATPRRSARCCKLSKKMIQIKEERQEETDNKKDVSQPVEKRKRMSKVKTHKNNHQIIEETCDGLMRSSRIRKPTTEILNFRKELKDDVYELEDGDINVERSSSYLQKSKRKKPNLSHRSSAETPEKTLEKSPQVSRERAESSHVITEEMLNSTDLPPPVRRKVFTPPAADVTTITPRQARKLCNMTKTVPPVSEHVPAVQFRPPEELLAVARHDVDENSASPPITATRSPSSLKIKKLVVLTESEEERDDQDAQLFPAALMKPMESPRDWNCFQVRRSFCVLNIGIVSTVFMFQCVYELSKLDNRLTISDLDPLLEKKVRYESTNYKPRPFRK